MSCEYALRPPGLHQLCEPRSRTTLQSRMQTLLWLVEQIKTPFENRRREPATLQIRIILKTSEETLI